MPFDNEVDDVLNSIKNNENKNSNGFGPSEDLLNKLNAIREEKPYETPEPPKDESDEKKKPFEFLKEVDIFKNVDFKKVGIIFCAFLVLIAVIFGGIKIVNHAKTGYVKEYEKKYNIDYPDGILKEFCDEYGKDQSLAGNLVIEDTSTDVRVYSKEKDGCALLEKGSDVKHEQHIRAIAIDKKLADLEEFYSTPEGFLESSQKVTFKTLLGEEEYRVVAAYYTNTNPKDDNGYVFPYNTYGNLTQKSFHNFQDRVKTRSLYDTSYTLLEENYILSISVPSDFMQDFRFVIVCVKSDGKFEKSKTATPNERIHYPQIWYDKNKQDNPYYLAGHWYPEIVLPNGKTKKLTIKDFQV